MYIVLVVATSARTAAAASAALDASVTSALICPAMTAT